MRDLAYEPAYAERAKYLFWVVFYNPDMVHPWGPYEDPLLAEYHNKYEFEYFRLKNKEGKESKRYCESEYLPRGVIDDLLKLVRSEDVATRTGAIGMLWFFDKSDASEEYENACKYLYKNSPSKEEAFLVSYVLCPGMTAELEISNKDDVHNIFLLRDSTYRNPELSFLMPITDINDCTKKTTVCNSMKAIHKFGDKFLNAYERTRLDNFIKGITP